MLTVKRKVLPTLQDAEVPPRPYRHSLQDAQEGRPRVQAEPRRQDTKGRRRLRALFRLHHRQHAKLPPQGDL